VYASLRACARVSPPRRRKEGGAHGVDERPAGLELALRVHAHDLARAVGRERDEQPVRAERVADVGLGAHGGHAAERLGLARPVGAERDGAEGAGLEERDERGAAALQGHDVADAVGERAGHE
jgi:hypothetical protein